MLDPYRLACWSVILGMASCRSSSAKPLSNKKERIRFCWVSISLCNASRPSPSTVKLIGHSARSASTVRSARPLTLTTRSASRNCNRPVLILTAMKASANANNAAATTAKNEIRELSDIDLLLFMSINCSAYTRPGRKPQAANCPSLILAQIIRYRRLRHRLGPLALTLLELTYLVDIGQHLRYRQVEASGNRLIQFGAGVRRSRHRRGLRNDHIGFARHFANLLRQKIRPLGQHYR